MKSAVERILVQIRPKIAAILRTRQHYDAKDLIGQFKTHIWGIMEQNNGAIFHASRYLLEKLNSCQRNFLKKLDMNEEAAFLDFNFAPPSLRRDIGILGMLHKRILELGHPIFDRLNPMGCQQGVVPNNCMAISCKLISNYIFITVPFLGWSIFIIVCPKK